MDKKYIVLLVFAAISLLVFIAFHLFFDRMGLVLSDLRECENAISEWNSICETIVLESNCNEKDISENNIPDCIWVKQGNGKCMRITTEQSERIPAEHIGIAGVPEECLELN